MTKDEQLILWEKFKGYAVDEDDCIEEPFLDFPKGTPKEDVWHWFEDNGPLDAFTLVYKGG